MPLTRGRFGEYLPKGVVAGVCVTAKTRDDDAPDGEQARAPHRGEPKSVALGAGFRALAPISAIVAQSHDLRPTRKRVANRHPRLHVGLTHSQHFLDGFFVKLFHL